MGLRRAASAIANLLFPPRCAGCATAGSSWCNACAATVRPRPGRLLLGCRYVCVGGAYQGPLRRAVLSLKRDRPQVATALVPALWRQRLPVDVDCVTWVPAGPGRRGRGYDQGRALALATSHMIGCPARGLLLRHGRRGQRALGAVDRRANAKASIVACGAVPGWRVLVVDDVVTTGASLEQAAAVLIAAGARSVDAAALADAPRGAAPQAG